MIFLIKNSLALKRQTVFYYHLYNDLSKAISALYPGNLLMCDKEVIEV